MQPSDIQALDRAAHQLFEQEKYLLAAQQCDIALELINYASPEALINAAMCYWHAGEFDLAADRVQHYIKIFEKSNTVDLQPCYKSLSAYLRFAGKFEQAEQVAQEKMTDSPDKSLHLGWFEMRRGNFKQSITLTDHGKQQNYWSSGRLTPNALQWSGQQLAGKTILICGESGCGDEIIFSRWLSDIKKTAAAVYYYTNNSLLQVFSRVFGVTPVTHPDQVNYDFWIPVMRLPYVLQSATPGSHAYLTADSSHEGRWRPVLEKINDKKIVINWTGNLTHPENKFRSVPLNLLVKYLGHRGQLISLQKTHNEKLPESVLDLSKKIESWDDTLAILNQCDLTVTCCTSIAHASAALGKPTIVLTNAVDYFTWCASNSGGKSDWYKNTWVFRQDSIKDWDSVFEQLAIFLDRGAK